MLIRSLGHRLVMVAAVAVTACGGGGGSTPTENSPPVIGTAPVAPPVDLSAYALQTGASVASYGATQDSGADETKIYNFVNNVRIASGAGALNQNVKLDAAGVSHANYNLLNSPYSAVLVETSGSPGFTGATYVDRQAAGGYSGMATSEGVTNTNALYLCAYLQLNSVYRLAALMDPSREIGVGVQRSDPAAAQGICVLESGYIGSPQYGASGALVTYPYPDQTGVPVLTLLDGDSPRPLPTVSGLVGQPILASMASMAVVTGDGTGQGSVDAFSLQDASGNPVPAYVVGSSALTMTNVERMDDANSNLYKPYQAVLVPKAPLNFNAKYTVTFSGKFNGIAHAKTWSFTTTKCTNPVQDPSCTN